jgi:hypothetical protein
MPAVRERHTVDEYEPLFLICHYCPSRRVVVGLVTGPNPVETSFGPPLRTKFARQTPAIGPTMAD